MDDKKVLLKKIERLEKIISLMPGHVYWKDKDGRYLGCNENQAKALGFKSSKEIIGKTDFDLPWKEQAQSLAKIDKEVITTEKTFTLEETVTLPDGKLATFLSKKVPLTNNGNKDKEILGISFDITDRKKLENELIDAIRSKSTFLSIASHEIKGPLSNSIYVLQKLEKTIQEDPAKTTDLLPLVRDQIKDSSRGVDTINYLLDFLNLDLTTDNLKEPREELFGSRLVKIMDPYEENYTNIEFSLNYDKQIPKVIFIPKGLEDIVEILIANAVKYSKKNAFININVSNIVKNDKNYLKISVEDNGVGINKSTLDRFFAPLLFEGMKDGERIYSAPAIKLSYIKKFIESLGGEFAIESELDVGTTVTITAPYEKSASDYRKFIPASFGEYKREKIKIPYRKLNFLIVEDNPLTLKLLEDEITKLGHHVDAVPNAHEAIKKAKEHDYEVAFLDISLPGMDGVELKHKLTRKGADFPMVIAITSHDSKIDEDYFIDHGFTAVIGKPFAKETIIGVIDDIQKVMEDISSDDENGDDEYR